MSFFDGANPFVIDRPVRLIELFAGIGAQAKAVERLGIEHELYRVSEWDVFANCSYRAIHCKDDTTDYSAGVSLEDVTEALIKAGLSSDGKTPLAPEQIKAKPEKMAPRRVQQPQSDAEHREHYTRRRGRSRNRGNGQIHIPRDVFFPVPRLEPCRKSPRNGERERHTLGPLVGV